MKKLTLSQTGSSSELFRTAVFIILSGGFQDAYTFIARGRVFANAQTGNIVLMSAALFRGEWQTAIKYLIPLASFFFGIIAAEAIHFGCKKHEKIHWRQIILAVEIVLLFSVGFIPSTADAVANALVSFVCALQVQSFHKINGHIYASTMCIGNMRSGAESLFAFVRTHEKGALKKALTYFGVIFVFAVGAGAGALTTSAVGNRAVWVCCILLSAACAIMIAVNKHKKSSPLPDE